MVKPLALIPPVAFAAIAGLFAAGMFLDSDGKEVPTALRGEPAPEMTLTDLPGLDPVTAEALRSGELKLVNFWASWCGPCRVEHPNLEALAEEGVQIYGINYKDNAEDALRFLDQLGNPYVAVSADPGGANALDWGVTGVPETFVVDAEGIVVTRIGGPLTTQTLEQRLRPVLDAGGGQSE